MRAPHGNTEQGSCLRAHTLSPTEGGCGLALGGAKTGIARADGKAREEIQAAPVDSQRRVIGEHITQDID